MAGDGEPSVSGLLGARIRSERAHAGLSIRELARRLDVSHSLISQIETGHVTPSVATLWGIATELGLPVGDLFGPADAGASSAAGPPPRAPSPVQDGETRRGVTLAAGVRWERLTPSPNADVDFVHVVYPPGSSSCEEDALIRHGGREFGYVISGRLGVRIGFDEFEVGPDDSICFDSQMPHRLWAIGDEPVRAIWMVLNRRGDARAPLDGGA